MRYIIRRSKPDDLAELNSRFPDLTQRLGQPGENLRRSFANIISPLRSEHFKFVTRKTTAGWQWVCPSIELVGESEADLLVLTDSFGLKKTDLKHLFSI